MSQTTAMRARASNEVALPLHRIGKQRTRRCERRLAAGLAFTLDESLRFDNSHHHYHTTNTNTPPTTAAAATNTTTAVAAAASAATPPTTTPATKTRGELRCRRAE